MVSDILLARPTGGVFRMEICLFSCGKLEFLEFLKEPEGRLGNLPLP